MKHRLALLAAVGASFFALPCAAQRIDVEPLAATELDELRGGFTLPMGIEANFGAIARTYSDNTLLLETHFTWTENGIERQTAAISPLLANAGAVLPNAFELRDANGATILSHHAEDNALANILLNDANGRDLRADFELTVTLPGFAGVQGEFSNSVLALRLTDDLNAAGY